MALFIYIIVFGLWMILNWHKYGFNVSTMIIALYFLGMCCGIILVIQFPTTIQYPERISIVAICFHIFLLFLLLIPLVRFGNKINAYSIIISIKQIRIFSYFIIIPSLISIVISLVTIKLLFSLSDFHSARQLFLDGALEGSYVTKLGPLGYVVSLGKCCSSFALILGMYYILVLKRYDYISVLLIISSFCYPLYSLSFAGRDGLVRWGVIFVFGLLLFKKYIFTKNNKKIIIILGILGLIGSTIFLKITFDRFESTAEGPVYSVLRYLGEQYYMFSYGFKRFGFDPMNNNILAPFPIITQAKSNALNLNDRFSADYYLNTFSTIAGSFLNSVGIINTVILFSIFFLILFLIFGKYIKISTVKFNQLIEYVLYYEVMVSGLFYNMYIDRFVQFGLVFYILLASYITKRYRISGNNSVKNSYTHII